LQYIVLLVAMLALFVVMLVLGFIYQSVIPAHFEEMYKQRFVDNRWNELFGVVTYAEVQGQVETNIMLVVVSCSMVIDGLVSHKTHHTAPCLLANRVAG
jgi:hypothetical protein